MKAIGPGHLDGKRGDCLRRFTNNGRVWHQHLKHKEYRCKVVGEELWPLKAGEEVDPGSIRTVQRLEVVGLELVSKMEHWWLDKEIDWPDLQQADWDFRIPRDGNTGPLVPLDHKIKEQHDRQPHAWQLPWAWQYECCREWQPGSDFDRWRKEWRKEAKRLRDPSTDWICGKRTREEADRDAAFSYGGRLPLWLLRDFAKYFPRTPWVKIPSEIRNTLKDVPPPGSVPIPLEGSLLALKEPDPNSEGFPPIPEKLRIEHNGFHSLRQPDPNNEEEKALYAGYQRKKSEALQRHREWLDAPGRYRDEVVKEITPGQFVGTYIVQIPWYHTGDDLKAGFAAWLTKKESELPGTRKKFTRTGWDKRYADLKQLGALRLLRSGMTAEKAAEHTQNVLGTPLFSEKGFSTAKGKADDNLAKLFGVG